LGEIKLLLKQLLEKNGSIWNSIEYSD
jgi:hypothetical protein